MKLKKITRKDGTVYFVDARTEEEVFVMGMTNTVSSNSKNQNNVDHDFCENCINETESISIGNIQTINFVGKTLAIMGDSCPKCQSFIVEKRSAFLALPLKSHGFFRIIVLKRGSNPLNPKTKFISRLLKDQEAGKKIKRQKGFLKDVFFTKYI